VMLLCHCPAVFHSGMLRTVVTRPWQHSRTRQLTNSDHCRCSRQQQMMCACGGDKPLALHCPLYCSSRHVNQGTDGSKPSTLPGNPNEPPRGFG
jgi:hypothetical protein